MQHFPGTIRTEKRASGPGQTGRDGQYIFIPWEFAMARKHWSDFLLQAKTFVHQSLEARFVENVVGKFFVGKHG